MDNIDPNNFAAKLNCLFEEKRKPDGTRYSQKEVFESAPGVLNRLYLWRLRKGKAFRPSYPVVKALADFFDVPPSYFFENGEIVADVVEDEDQNNLVQQIALRSAGLDKDGKQAVLFMIESIIKSKKTKD
jgi:transcriptional regulator with XRE-family HTH domain